MVALSGGVHVLAFLVFMAADAFHRRPLTESVAVVDLVGGAAPEPEAAPPAPPAGPPETRSRPAKAEKAVKAPPPPARRTEEPSPEKRSPAPKPPAAPAAHPSPEGTLPRPAPEARKAPPPPDARSAEEAIRAMRERVDGSGRVRDFVARRQMEREAASAIGRVRERTTRQVDLSAIRPQQKGGGTRGGASGAAGNVRATAEQMEYFRALDDRIRANWIAPRGDTRSLIVQVVVTIEKNGTVSSVILEKGSGNEYFDDSVKRAIHKASPLPVPPERLRGGEDCYSVGFRFYGTAGGEG